MPLPEVGCTNRMALDGFDDMWERNQDLRKTDLFQPPMLQRTNPPVSPRLRGWRRALHEARRGQEARREYEARRAHETKPYYQK